jgi:hypothetical protein
VDEALLLMNARARVSHLSLEQVAPGVLDHFGSTSRAARGKARIGTRSHPRRNDDGDDRRAEVELRHRVEHPPRLLEYPRPAPTSLAL